ncbi:MAG: SAM-dependent methyltransferase, partial [Blastocatellia bacterium]
MAQQDAEDNGLENVEFRCADAATCQDDGGYDLVYARFVLTHLAEPDKCLESMLLACKPNGLIV